MNIVLSFFLVYFYSREVLITALIEMPLCPSVCAKRAILNSLCTSLCLFLLQ